MSTSRGRLTFRMGCLVVLTAITFGCQASPSSSAGGTPQPSGNSSQPGSAAPTPLASGGPTSSPISFADVFENVPLTEGALNSVWASGGRAVAGGFGGPGFTSSILVFDGETWSAADVPDAPGQVTGVVEFNGRLIAVGNGLPDIRDGFIWESVDGQVWRSVETIPNAALYDLATGGGVVVAVGARLDPEMNATATAWTSADGTTWEPADVAGNRGTSMGSVTVTPDGFGAIGDRPLGQARPFWTAATSASWDVLENDMSDQLLPADIVYGADRIVLVGASGKSGDQHPFVAFSADGRQWKQTNFSQDEGYASAVAAAGEELVIAGVDADRLTLWSLRDGAWETSTIEPTGASISALAWDPDMGLVGVGARNGGYAAWSVRAP